MGAFKNAKAEHVGALTASWVQKNVEAKMKSYGEGSRAVLSFGWKKSSGHVINLEYKNGKVHYNDAQIGAKYKANELFKAVKTSTVDIVRTDNLKFSDRAKKSITTRYSK